MTTTTPTSYRSFALLTSLFFMWGFITVTNDVLINTFKGIFDLTPVQRSLVQFAFFGAFFVVSLLYFIISSSSGKDPINKVGYNNGMFYSLLICGLGCVLFYPAGQLNSYPAFLAALFLLATGVTLLQICANPYAAILGSQESASSRLNLAQGLNSLGTTLGPLVGALLIYQLFSNGNATADSVGKTYLVYGGLFILLAALVKVRKMPPFVNNQKIESGLAVLKQRHLALGILAIFFYVGSEVAVGTWLVELLKSDATVGLSEQSATYFLSYFWGGLMIGRLMASTALKEGDTMKRKVAIMAATAVAVFALIYLVTSLKIDKGTFRWEFLSFGEVYLYLIYIALSLLALVIGAGKPARSLAVFAGANILLLSTGILSSGEVAFWSMVGTGLFFSIGWTNVFSLAIRDLGKLTSQGSSLLVMAVVGGALLPAAQGWIIEKGGAEGLINGPGSMEWSAIQLSFIVPLVGMIYLLFYGLNGYKISKK